MSQIPALVGLHHQQENGQIIKYIIMQESLERLVDSFIKLTTCKIAYIGLEINLTIVVIIGNGYKRFLVHLA